MPPTHQYDHSGGRCSITGGYVYRGAQAVLPSGNYVYGDFCSGEIFAWDGAQRTLLDTAENIVSFGEDEQGELYVVGLSGSVSRLVRVTACNLSISPVRASFGAAGGNGVLVVRVEPGCHWAVRSSAAWVAATPSAGAGDGNVNFTVALYRKGKSRVATLMVNGQTLTITQTK